MSVKCDLLGKKATFQRSEIEAEYELRTQQVAETTKPMQTESRVEAFMRKCAPDMFIDKEAAQDMPAEHLPTRPGPRFVVLILLVTVLIMQPMLIYWLGVWIVLLFLVLSLIVGPERARDSYLSVATWCYQFALHEMVWIAACRHGSQKASAGMAAHQ